MIAWRGFVAAAVAAFCLAGCGSGGGDIVGPFAPGAHVRVGARGVPVTLEVVGEGRQAAIDPAVAGDEVLLVFVVPRDLSGSAYITVNGGGQLASLPLPASRAAGRARRSRDADPDQRSFKFLGSSFTTIDAAMVYDGVGAAIYRDQATDPSALTDEDIADLGEQLDSFVVPFVTEHFGPPSDVDQNGRVLALLTPRVVPPKFGYFYRGDVEPNGSGNNADLVYMRVPNPAGGEGYEALREALLATLVHELQHLANFNQKGLVHGLGIEESWLNEGLSFLSEDLAGLLDTAGGSPENVAEYFAAPERFTLLEKTGFYDDGHAGAGYLFCRWLADRFGESIASELVQSGSTGVANIEAATGDSFDDLLADWAAAIWLAGTGLSSDSRYSLPGFRTRAASYLDGAVELNGPQATPVDAASGEPSFEFDLPRGGVRYIRLRNLSGDGTILTVTAPDEERVRMLLIRVPKGT